MYKLRLWLAYKFFYCGKLVHPDISRLRKEIEAAQRNMSIDHITVDDVKNRLGKIIKYES